MDTTPTPDNHVNSAEVAEMLRDIAFEASLTAATTGIAKISAHVLAALARVPRARFLPEDLRFLAFRDGPAPIGFGQTISQPFMVALMTDLLRLDHDSRVLEVGTGSGYQTAVLAELAGQVYSIEIVPPLAQAARARLTELGYGNLHLRDGDGYAGWPEAAPFDAIVVTAAAPRLPPPLIKQLQAGGRLVIPLGAPGHAQVLSVIEKTGVGEVQRRDVLDVAFVPLTGAKADADAAGI